MGNWMFKLKEKIAPILKEMDKVTPDNFVMMEVCGTHTMNIAKFGLRTLLPKKDKDNKRAWMPSVCNIV